MPHNSSTSRPEAETEKPVGLGIYFGNGTQFNYDSRLSFQSSHNHLKEPLPQEKYEDKLSRHKKFFEDGALMGCLDKHKDAPSRDVLFNTLLTDVQQKQDNNPGYRGIIKVRSFWEDVRKQLSTDDEEACTLEGEVTSVKPH